LEQEPAKQNETRNRREFNIGLNVDMGARMTKKGHLKRWTNDILDSGGKRAFL
jgi:hypothetical protein